MSFSSIHGSFSICIRLYIYIYIHTQRANQSFFLSLIYSLIQFFLICCDLFECFFKRYQHYFPLLALFIVSVIYRYLRIYRCQRYLPLLASFTVNSAICRCQRYLSLLAFFSVNIVIYLNQRYLPQLALFTAISVIYRYLSVIKHLFLLYMSGVLISLFFT